jgi:large subunit ribosomal protein L6
MPKNVRTVKVIKVPDKVKVEYKDNALKVTGPKGTLSRSLDNPRISVGVTPKEITVSADLPNRKEYALVGTYEAHIKNMIEGVTNGYIYRMKIVYSHFPIKVSVKGTNFLIENFLGEKFPRNATICSDAKVEVSGDQVTVSGFDLEKVSQTAANIEKATVIRNYDPRVFQDGIYIISKGD